MRVKAVIFRPDRRLRVVRMREGALDNDLFRHDNNMYRIDPDRMIVTTEWKMFVFKWHYSTYYFIQGITNPIPAPDFKCVIRSLQKKKLLDQDGNPVKDKDGKDIEVTEADYKDVVNLGVSAPAMSSIFNPWFYRTIGAIAKDKFLQFVFFITLANACGTAFLIWKMLEGSA